MDRLQSMQIFAAVVEAGGLAGAARRLGISPPAVTRAIAELERRLGAKLLTRTTRVVRVTDAGARYVEDCRRILADVAEADESAAGMHAAPRGRLTLTAPALFGGLHVTPIVVEYLRRHPEVSVACWFVDRVVNMIEEGADVAVRIGELPDSSAHAIRVGAVRRVVCATAAYLKRHGTPKEPADLRRHAIIGATAAPVAEWKFGAGGAPRVLRLEPRLSATTNDAAIAAATAGFGLAQVLSYQVADALRAGTLRAVLVDHEPEPLPVNVVHGEGLRAAQKIRTFVDLAVERLRRHPAIR